MVATFCLYCCVLATAQPVDRTESLVAPRLARAQELVYRGSCMEESSANGVQFSRAYRVETRIFVLDATTQGSDVAVQTVVKLRTPPSAPGSRIGAPADDATLYSARLELASIDAQGRISGDARGALTLPLDGPPAIECGAFVELPRKRSGAELTWEVTEEGRSPRTWKWAGTEAINGASCIKLIGVQQSEDWDRPRADRAAWRRQDTVWLTPRTGIAQRVERIIERRDPARRDPTYRTELRYELESGLQYPGQLFLDRRREITQTRAFADSAAPLVQTPSKNKPQLDALLGKINQHLETQPPTPYRESLLQVKRRVEAARRGESAPAPVESIAPAAATAAVGKSAPDFVAPDFLNKESARLRRWYGKPVLMVFYNPGSPTADDLLRYAQSIQDAQRDQVSVIALAMSSDADRVRKQHAALRLTLSVLNGQGLRISYAVEATPRMVLLDAEGVVRAIHVGWGREASHEIGDELKRLLAEKK